MARTKEEPKEKQEKKESPPINEVLAGYLKDNREHHFNLEEEVDYKSSSGSLLLDVELGGGFGPGCHRFVGANSGGKTSEALEAMRNFLLTVPQSRGVYVKAEGRLDKEMQERSGVTFTTKAEEWENGKCFIFESNVFETVFDLVRMLVKASMPINEKNPDKRYRYFFIIDSVDGLKRKEDLEKTTDESQKVAGGALLTSTFLSTVNGAMCKFGHIFLPISQMRAEVKIDTYAKTLPRYGNASGGQSLYHYPVFILEFLPRYQEDLILLNPSAKPYDKGNKIIGHYCKAKIIKSNNEKNYVVVTYPIRYGRKDGNSIWVEYEITDLLQAWDLLKRAGSWYTVDEQIINELKENKLESIDKFQGVDTFREFLEKNPKTTNYLRDKFKKLLISGGV
jgi:RecA/RadA recombinase